MVDGIDELVNKLNEMINLDDVVKKAVKNGCKVVQAEAKLLCPVDKGELRNSIRTKVDNTGDKIVGTIYTNKSYASYVEFGTGPKGEADHDGISPNITPSYKSKGWSYYDKEKDKYIHTRGQPAQPYMYPALHNNIDTAKASIARKVKKSIKDMIKQC